MFFVFCNFQSVERGGDSIKGIEQQSTFECHTFRVPMFAWHIEGGHAACAGLDTSAVRSEVDRDVIHFSRHEPTHETPKLAWQNIRLAVHRADDVACL